MCLGFKDWNEFICNISTCIETLSEINKIENQIQCNKHIVDVDKQKFQKKREQEKSGDSCILDSTNTQTNEHFTFMYNHIFATL